ncbi:MAG: hypothetical protein EBZ78_10235 [Verrucomicrobia bacterium]|nr:hypothetical protein [Verrucomicrobiota bacterium]
MNTTATQRPSLQGLINSTSIPESLVRAVVRQMGGWQSFKESAPDICRGGIDGGFSGFISYADTMKFAKKNREAIRQLAMDQAQEFGLGVVEMIKGFGCFRHSKPSDREIIDGLAGIAHPMGVNVLNALAWYAGEEVARAFCDAFDPQ